MGNIYWEDIPANTTQGDGAVMRCGSGGAWESKVQGIVNISFIVPSPLASRGAWITIAGQDLIIKRIDSCVRAATSATFNIQIHATPAGAGTNVLSTDQTATTSGASTTTIASAAVSRGEWLFIDISAVSGYIDKKPQALTVTITAAVS